MNEPSKLRVTVHGTLTEFDVMSDNAPTDIVLNKLADEFF